MTTEDTEDTEKWGGGCAGSGERGGGFGFVEARGGSIFYCCVFVSDRGLDFCGVGRGVN
jgi:hypothetical protein